MYYWLFYTCTNRFIIILNKLLKQHIVYSIIPDAARYLYDDFDFNNLLFVLTPLLINAGYSCKTYTFAIIFVQEKMINDIELLIFNKYMCAINKVKLLPI